MKSHLYLIHAVTNLHVGSGDTIGIVDRTVQRDPITYRPIIHGSSLKGALREFCKHHGFKALDTVFGSEAGNKTTPGAFNFFSAHLISMPLRSDKSPFFNTTCPGAIAELITLASYLGITLPQKEALERLTALNPGDNEAIVFSREANDGKLEGLTIRAAAQVAGLDGIIGPSPALLNDKTFTAFCKDELPVIARNHLGNGKSTNLWYEEVVPRESRFVFALIADDAHDADFMKVITSHMVQIGGNATVGYGFTKITKLA